MDSTIKRFFWLEAALAIVAGVTLVLMLLWPQWVELALGVDPDQGSGAFEWFVTLASAVSAATLTVLTRSAWVLRARARVPASAQPET